MILSGRLSSNTAAVLSAGALALSLAACGPSIDPAAKADIDKRISVLAPGSTAVPAPTGFVPMPLASGQWTQYKMLNDKNEPSFITYKILGEEAGAYWMEVVHETYTGKMIQKMLVAFGSRTDPGQIEIRAVKTKDQKGNVNEFPREMMSMLQPMYRSAVAMMVINWQGLPQEAAAVPAGRFDGCFKTRTEAQWGPWKTVADSWSHPSVPLSGAVKTQGVDKPFSMELVAFGTSGATGEL